MASNGAFKIFPDSIYLTKLSCLCWFCNNGKNGDLIKFPYNEESYIFKEFLNNTTIALTVFLPTINSYLPHPFSKYPPEHRKIRQAKMQQLYFPDQHSYWVQQ